MRWLGERSLAATAWGRGAGTARGAFASRFQIGRRPSPMPPPTQISATATSATAWPSLCATIFIFAPLARTLPRSEHAPHGGDLDEHSRNRGQTHPARDHANSDCVSAQTNQTGWSGTLSQFHADPPHARARREYGTLLAPFAAELQVT